jgi:hypothetical protein
VESGLQAIIDLLNAPEKRVAMSRCATHRINTVLNWDIQKMQLEKAYDAAFGHAEK